MAVSIRLPKRTCFLIATVLVSLYLSLHHVVSGQEIKKKNFSTMWELVSSYAAESDRDGLHRHLTALFDASERQLDPSKRRISLSSGLSDRGAGFTKTTRHKLVHDLEQFEYILQEPSLRFNPTTQELLGVDIPKAYQAALDKLDAYARDHPEWDEETEFFELDPTDPVLEWYNRAFFTPAFGDKIKQPPPATQYGNQLATSKTTFAPLLNPDLDFSLYERQWFGEEPSHDHPGIVVIDNLLSPQALQKVRDLLLLSTVWYETKTPVFGKYVGAYIGDGLHDKLLLAIADDLFHAMPRVMAKHYLKYMWAYHYESSSTSEDGEAQDGIHTHADDAAVKVNIWLTPDEANLNAETGGLVVYTTKPPSTWGFDEFNSNWEFVNKNLLEPNGFVNVTVPYKQNRAVLFDSFLFHKTDQFQFAQGYANRRINLTILYGNRHTASTSQNKDNEL